MQAVEPKLEELFKYHPEFLQACQQVQWGKIEIVVRDGKPVMISVKRDIKLN